MVRLDSIGTRNDKFTFFETVPKGTPVLIIPNLPGRRASGLSLILSRQLLHMSIFYGTIMFMKGGKEICQV